MFVHHEAFEVPEWMPAQPSELSQCKHIQCLRILQNGPVRLTSLAGFKSAVTKDGSYFCHITLCDIDRVCRPSLYIG